MNLIFSPVFLTSINGTKGLSTTCPCQDVQTFTNCCQFHHQNMSLSSNGNIFFNSLNLIEIKSYRRLDAKGRGEWAIGSHRPMFFNWLCTQINRVVFKNSNTWAVPHSTIPLTWFGPQVSVFFFSRDPRGFNMYPGLTSMGIGSRETLFVVNVIIVLYCSLMWTYVHVLREAEASRRMVVMDGTDPEKWKGMSCRPQDLPWMGEYVFCWTWGREERKYTDPEMFIYMRSQLGRRVNSSVMSSTFFWEIENKFISWKVIMPRLWHWVNRDFYASLLS